MNAETIRDILNTEATELRIKGNNSASHALRGFIDNATDDELVRFREILTQTDRADWVEDPNNPMSRHHY